MLAKRAINWDGSEALGKPKEGGVSDYSRLLVWHTLCDAVRIRRTGPRNGTSKGFYAMIFTNRIVAAIASVALSAIFMAAAIVPASPTLVI